MHLHAVISRFRLAVVLAGLALGCGSGSSSEGDGIGVVRAIGTDRGTITIEHGDIPGLMKAMTMTFHAESPALLEGLAPGQAVDFHVREEAGGRYVLTRIAPFGDAR